MSEIFHADPNRVTFKTEYPSERDIKYQMARLEAEGQIEPLEVIPAGSDDQQLGFDWIVYYDAWPYSPAQVVAARRLEWPTILVTPDRD